MSPKVLRTTLAALLAVSAAFVGRVGALLDLVQDAAQLGLGGGRGEQQPGHDGQDDGDAAAGAHRPPPKGFSLPRLRKSSTCAGVRFDQEELVHGRKVQLGVLGLVAFLDLLVESLAGQGDFRGGGLGLHGRGGRQQADLGLFHGAGVDPAGSAGRRLDLEPAVALGDFGQLVAGLDRGDDGSEELGRLANRRALDLDHDDIRRRGQKNQGHNGAGRDPAWMFPHGLLLGVSP